jgi:hypothetical protein
MNAVRGITPNHRRSQVRESLFCSNELDALRRHNQALVDTKTGLESQLETCHARLVERSSYVVEMEAKVTSGLRCRSEFCFGLFISNVHFLAFFSFY